MSKAIITDLRRVLSRHTIPHGAVEDANLPALLDASMDRRCAAATAAHARNRDAFLAAREALRLGDTAKADAILLAAWRAEMDITPQS